MASELCLKERILKQVNYKVKKEKINVLRNVALTNEEASPKYITFIHFIKFFKLCLVHVKRMVKKNNLKK